VRWEFASDRPISTQIVETIQKGILSGVYPPGSNMPSVRALAVDAGVNPNTMQKALAELESQGLLRTQRTSGRTVTKDERLIMRLREQTSSGYVEQYFAHMRDLGIERDAAAALVAARVGGSPSGGAAGRHDAAVASATNVPMPAPMTAPSATTATTLSADISEVN